MKIILAIDSFKGCLTSAEANRAAAEGVMSADPAAAVEEIAVSDGGEGFVEAYRAAAGGTVRDVFVHDALMRPVRARYLMIEEGGARTAVAEAAQACGLAQLAASERNPLLATSYGVGEIVADAIRAGATHVIVGLGGSATSDAGIGMLNALADARTELEEVRFTIATDVANPLCGRNGAARVFGPQKGASEDDVVRLDERARRFAAMSAERLGHDMSEMPGAGAAGGLGYAFMQYAGATRRPGAEVLLEAAAFGAKALGADLVITGEGSADRQTLMGKLPTGILRQAPATPVALIAGRVSDRERLQRAGFAYVECINPPGLSPDEAMRREVAVENIRRTVERIMASPRRPRRDNGLSRG